MMSDKMERAAADRLRGQNEGIRDYPTVRQLITALSELTEKRIEYCKTQDEETKRRFAIEFNEKVDAIYAIQREIREDPDLTPEQRELIADIVAEAAKEQRNKVDEAERGSRPTDKRA